jgi:hypothetical protein
MAVHPHRELCGNKGFISLMWTATSIDPCGDQRQRSLAYALDLMPALNFA